MSTITTSKALVKPFPDDLRTVANETYIIDREIKLSSDLSIASGATLIFQGGKFSSDIPVTISAPAHNPKGTLIPLSGVSIEAPFDIIFGENISVDGVWISEFITPLWFEPTMKPNHVPGPDIKDYSDPINKAIKMCIKGTVYLPKGDYFISKPIFIPEGITLQGDYGQLYEHASTSIFPLGTMDKTTQLTSSFTKEFPYDYMFYVNCDINKSPIRDFANPWIAIRGITLINYPDVNKKSRCAYACYGAGFDSVIWYDFIQAVSYSTHYGDGKCIMNCSSGYDSKFNDDIYENSDVEGDFFMFDLKGLGDSVLFMHNHLGSPLNKVLYMSLCGGGSFQGNILNGDVSIHGSKGISFSDNHMEGGAQLRISQSIVALSSNYIEKGSRPSIVVTGIEKNRCIVSLTNDQFSFYNTDRSSEESEDISLKKERIENICEYDIEINSKAYLNLNNVFRYDIVVGFDVAVPFGIKINTDAGALAAFNDASYYCSRQSCILPGYVVEGNTTVKKPNTPRFYYFQNVKWVNWLRPTGTYRYFYQVFWDVKRNIKRSTNNNTLFPLPSAGDTITFQDDSQGALLNIDGFDNGNCMLIRMYREHVSDENGNNVEIWETVDIPLCGADMIYDNGISICGFKWSRTLAPTELINSAIQYDYLKLNSGKVEAWTPVKISNLSNWELGDIIYNSSGLSSWTQIIVK